MLCQNIFRVNETVMCEEEIAQVQRVHDIQDVAAPDPHSVCRFLISGTAAVQCELRTIAQQQDVANRCEYGV